VIDQPYLGERFVGNGQLSFGVTRNGVSRLATRRTTALADAMIWASSTITTLPHLFTPVQALVPVVRMLRYGSDCLAMAMLAEGHFDVVIEAGLEIYDIAAQVPVVRGAGGVITGLDGGDPLASNTILAAATPELHACLLERLVAHATNAP